MYDPYRGVSLLEQKKQQWAKEREELVGLCGLWGTQPDRTKDSAARKSQVLPPIQGKPSNEDVAKDEEYASRPEEESETSGYLSDSPKHRNEVERTEPWEELNQTTSEDYWEQRKMYKNLKNETWAQQSTDSWLRNKSSWYGTPDSTSSDDGRAKWGDRGVGVGHLWEPVTHQPDSRLPQVPDVYRTPPKWVERGLKQADILVIHHSDDEGTQTVDSSSNEAQANKNFLLGQNVPLPPDIMEERERKRRKAQEHQNAIRKQLEERERKRKEEREKRIKEERMEEERIQRDQEIDRLRLEQEQRRNRDKEDKEKRKEEVMKEALEHAEKQAQAAKKKVVRKQVSIVEESGEKERPERKKLPKTPRLRNEVEERTTRREVGARDVRDVKDTGCQFEALEGGGGGRGMQWGGLPVEGGLALVLDTPQAEGNLLMPSEGMQLALLMSPGNVSSQIIPISLSSSLASSYNGRVLTPSKYRGVMSPRNKATQTDRWCCSGGRKKRQCDGQRSGRASRFSDTSEKSNSLERPHAHSQCQNSNRFRSRSQPRLSIEDRPKWGINRPSVQYKKQSEKDPYYQRRLLKMKTKKAEPIMEKLLDSEMRLLRFMTDDEDVADVPDIKKESDVLRNGFRMVSNPSSPRFVRIPDEEPSKEEEEATTTELAAEETPPTEDDTTEEKKEDPVDAVATEDVDDDAEVVNSVLLDQRRPDVVEDIATLRQGLEKLQRNLPSTRSGTPYSECSEQLPPD